MGTKVEINNSKGIPFILIILLTLVGYFGYSYYLKYKEVKALSEEYRQNLYTLSDTVKQLKTFNVKLNDSITVQAANARKLTLKVEDWKDLYSDQAKEFKKLHKNLNEVQSVTTLKTESKGVVQVPIYIKNDSIKFEKKESWIDVKFEGYKDKGTLTYNKREKLDLTIFVKQKKFLFIKIGEKIEGASVMSLDPNTTIEDFTYTKIVQ